MECGDSILGILRLRTSAGDVSGFSAVKTPGFLEDFCGYDKMLKAKMRGLFSSVLEDQGHNIFLIGLSLVRILSAPSCHGPWRW